MEATAEERVRWQNRGGSEMHLGLAEWVERKRGAGKVVTQYAVIEDVRMELKEAGLGRVKHVSGQMNGLEKRYAAYLEIRKVTGEILDYRFEPMKLRLAPSTFLDVDFMVVMPDQRLEFHEVKGHWEDDARVKIKMAPGKFPWFRFLGVTWNKPMKDWKFEEFKA